MSKFINTNTQVVVSVADDKDERFAEGWDLVSADKPAKAAKPASK